MKLLTFSIAAVILLVITGSTVTKAQDIECKEETNGEIRLVKHSRTCMDTLVQMCARRGEWEDYDWRYIIANDAWTDTAAAATCRHLRLPDSGAIASMIVRTMGTVAVNVEQCTNSNPLPDCIQFQWGMTLAGVYCTNLCRRGDIRLADGDSNRDGMVEVCMNNQWVAVCSDDQQTNEVADVVCTQLGFPRRVARLETFPLLLEHCFHCRGNETKLTQCNMSTLVNGRTAGIRVTCMSHDEAAMNICSTPTVDIPKTIGSCSTPAQSIITKRAGLDTFDLQTDLFHCFRCLGNETILTQCTRSVNSAISHPMGIRVTCISHDEAARTICSTPTVAIPKTISSCHTKAHPNIREATTVTIMNANSICPTQSPSTICEVSTVTITKSHQTQDQPATHVAPTVHTTTTASCSISLTANPNGNNTSGARREIDDNIRIFQAITGILLVVLIAVIMGWILTCIVMGRKTKTLKQSDRHDEKQNTNTESSSLLRQLDNPVYDGTDVQPHPPANYSSLGPAYELVQTNEGAGHTYDVINRNQQRGRSTDQGELQQQNTVAESAVAGPTPDNNYNILDHTGHAGGQQGQHVQDQSNKKRENDYRVLEQSSETTPTNDEEHYYYVLENNSSAVSGRTRPPNILTSGNPQQPTRGQGGGDVNIDPDPQDYEIPTPTMKPRGVGEDEEEYSTLKH